MVMWKLTLDPAYKRYYSNPATSKGPNAFTVHKGTYEALWARYSNEIHDTTVSASWAGYRVNYGLYRMIRSIYNPTSRLVDFYASSVWPGALSEDGCDLPDGLQLAIPFSKDTSPKLKAAIAQLWQWWNLQSLKAIIPRQGAALGSVLVELMDDVERGKILLNVEWPGNVVDLELDHSGNIVKYAIEYYTEDPIFANAGTKPQYTPSYLFRKEVDKTEFRYYKNGTPHDYYGNGSAEPNPYGFVPARWFKHRDDGGPHGVAAISGSEGKIDELNSLASQLNDYIAKAVEMPKVLWADGKITALGTSNANKQEVPTTDLPRRYRDKETVNILTGPPGGRVDDLITALDIPGVLEAIDRLQAEIENDHPELAFYKQLRSMSSLTGPAASRIMGDTESLLQEVSSNYDQGMISLFRMGVAMAGLRQAIGADGWANPTDQQLKFKYFSLDSYERGKLDMAIVPRSLLQPSKSEQAQERLTFYQSIKAAQDAGLPFETALEDAGFDAKRIEEIKLLKEEKKPAQLQEANAMLVPPNQLPAQSPQDNQQVPQLVAAAQGSKPDE